MTRKAGAVKATSAIHNTGATHDTGALHNTSAMHHYIHATNQAHEVYVNTTTLAWEYYQRATADAWGEYLAHTAHTAPLSPAPSGRLTALPFPPTAGGRGELRTAPPSQRPQGASRRCLPPNGRGKGELPSEHSGVQPPSFPGQASASGVRDSQEAASDSVAGGSRERTPRPTAPGNPEPREQVGLPSDEWAIAVEMLAAAADGRSLEATFQSIWNKSRDLLTEHQRTALQEFNGNLQAFLTAGA